MPEDIGKTLAVDHGGKRIGLAVCDEFGLIAMPLRVVEVGRNRDAVFAEIAAAAVAENAVRLVVGLPLNMDGTEGPQAQEARRFGDELGRRTALPVEYVDERLTSYAAEHALRAAELTRGKKKARLDAVAAAMILNAWLEARRPPPGS